MKTYQVSETKRHEIAPLATLLKAAGYAVEYNAESITTDAPFSLLTLRRPPPVTERDLRELCRAAMKGNGYYSPGITSVFWPADETFTVQCGTRQRGSVSIILNTRKSWSNSGKRAYAWLAAHLERQGVEIQA